MSHKQQGPAALRTNLVLPIALVLAIGIAQIVFAFGVLAGRLSHRWLLPITLLGTFLTMAMIAYTTIYRLKKAHALRKSIT